MILHPWATFRRAGELLLTQRALWGLAVLLGLTQSAAWLTVPAPTTTTPDPSQALSACLGSLIILGLSVVSLAASIGVLTLATDRALGGTMPLGVAWAQGWSRWWAVFVFGLLLGLILALPALLLVLLALAIFGLQLTTPTTSVWFSAVMLLIGVLYAPVANLGQCRVAVAFQTPSAGLRRAWTLFRAQPRALLGLALLLAIIPGLLGLLPSLLLDLTPLGTADMLAGRLVLWPLAVAVLGFASSWELVAWALAHLTLDPPPAPVSPPALFGQ